MIERGKPFTIDDNWIKKALAWADHHLPYLAYFSSNDVPYPHGGFEQVLYGGETSCSFDQLKDLPDNREKIGILGYDLKNRFENLQSKNPSLIHAPETIFFSPSLKITFTPGRAEIFYDSPDMLFEQVCSFNSPEGISQNIKISPLSSRQQYLERVKKIQNHIIEGDIYELNYCMAFEGTFEIVDPIHVYFDLMKKSPMPFSVFFKAKHQYLAGASPERFLKRSGLSVIAQPIKGTIKRGNTPEEDQQLYLKLKNSEKERAENLMIVDLMRNDLARISKTGTVRVEELFGIYRFKSIHQMISTVSSTLREGVDFEEIIAKTFPMGSMTGAPKIRAMELIDEYENFKRGWFSGAVGYISPDGDFDFNVVIRSIVIDKASGKLYFAVGSAITSDADPVQEYEECLLKARPVFDVLAGAGGE